MNRQRKGRLMLLFLAVVFILPVIIGLYLYNSHQRVEGKSHGELLQPPRKLPLADSQGWKEKWHLVYVSSGMCADECRSTLRMMRQVHASLDKNIDRIQRVWVIDGDLAPNEVASLQQQYPDLHVLNNSGDKARQFDLPNQPATAGGSLYLVDPLGNLMMRYPKGGDPMGIRKDLTRLLTYSWTG